MTNTSYQIAIIGAGPYGLAAAAYLRSANLDVKVFGHPMAFWRTHMPRGMWLRSSWSASHIADPARQFSLDEYERLQGVRFPRPLPLQYFVSYGQWFQQNVVPDVDAREIERIERSPAGYKLSFRNDECCIVERVVMATGIAPFAHRPSFADGLPKELVSHSSDHQKLDVFSGKRVLVVGAGQSALESAALLREAGSEVEVLVRGRKVRWLRKYTGFASKISTLYRLMYPPSDVGPPILNQIVARPQLFKSFPESLQERIADRSIRSAGSSWLVPRVAGVRITTGSGVREMRIRGEQALLKLRDGSERSVDHVVLATGYKVDVAKYQFIAAELLHQIRRNDGYPHLNRGFESSLPGLYFLGAPAAQSFGPLMRFVSGTGYAAASLRHHIVAQGSKRSLERVVWSPLMESRL